MREWLKFFRVVNLPTVPGDVLAGAAVAVAGGEMLSSVAVIAACLASIALYMFGLADNDIIGAKSDVDRPIPDGAISMCSARMARGFCLFVTLAVGVLSGLPKAWWISVFMLAVSIVVYNRTKWSLIMGLCRGLNLICGVASVSAAMILCVPPDPHLLYILGFATLWTAYVAMVTRYSEGEEKDAIKKHRVGLLVGGIIYLQLTVLIVYRVTPLLLAGALLLIVLRILKRILPEVSAS